MDIALEDFIQVNYNPEQQSQLKIAGDLMESFGIEEYEGSLLEIVSYGDMLDKLELQDRFSDLTLAWVEQVNQDHGVHFTEEATLESMLISLKALELLQAWLEHSDIVRVTEGDNSPEEVYCELVELTTGTSMENYLTQIYSVDTALLRSIQRLHENQEDEDANTVAASGEQVERLRHAIAFVGDSELGERILNIGYPLGAPIAFYAKLLKKQLEYLDEAKLARELFVVLHMGSDSWSNIISGFGKISDTILDDLGRISTVDVGIKRLTSSFTGYLAHHTATEH